MKRQKIILGEGLAEEVLTTSSKVSVTQCWISQRTAWKGSRGSMIDKVNAMYLLSFTIFFFILSKRFPV
jgi:hypothetical protein